MWNGNRKSERQKRELDNHRKAFLQRKLFFLGQQDKKNT